MSIVGVIAEYNPFHNGHLYHLNKAKEMFKDSYFVLILIGNFTQRGEISVIDKWDKTKIALDYGYDLVIELPYVFATQSASYYAKGAIEILKKINCNYLVFGSELNDVDKLRKLADITHENKEYESLVKKYISSGVNYPKASSLALMSVSDTMIDKPNDVLALEYIRQIKLQKANIMPISIKRTNDYHEDKIKSNITSATSIRKNIDNINLIKDVMPNDVIKYIKKIDYDKYFYLIKYQILSSDNLSNYLGVTEGLENKLKKEINTSSNLNELILNIKSKRYSYNRISRLLNHIVCKTKNYENISNIKYIRVLGLNKRGTNILKNIKKNIDVPIITKYKKEYDHLFKTDYKANLIYSLVTDYDIKNEFRSSINKN